MAAKVIIHGNELFQEFKGSYVENYVAQKLARLKCNLNYWTSEGEAEVDYVMQIEDTIYPFEIKSGTSGKKKSLQIYQGKYQPKLSIRASSQNLKRDGNLLNIPFYLLSNCQDCCYVGYKNSLTFPAALVIPGECFTWQSRAARSGAINTR